MRARLVITLACVACLVGAASWTTSARSQGVATTALTTATTMLTPTTSTSTTPATTTSTGASDPSTATTSQSDTEPTADPTETDAPEDDPDVPEVVVDFPDTDETASDDKDDGVLEAVPADNKTAQTDPGPTPVAVAPAAAAPVAVTPEVAPEQPAAKSGQDKPKDDQAADPTPSPLPPVAPTSPLETPAAVAAQKAAEAAAAARRAADDRAPALKKLTQYKPAAHAEEVLAVTAGGAATIGALAAGLAAGGGGGSGSRRSAAAAAGRSAAATAAAGGGDDGGDGGGWLEGVEIEREAGMLPGYGWGDRSRTHAWRLTPRVDTFSTTAPVKLAKVSPVLGRVTLDGDYLRAIMGGLYVALFPIAIALGLIAASTTGGAALPPTFGLFIAILALSIFDSAVGYAAGAAFGLSLLISGDINDAASIRLVAGLILVWFAVPLGASAVRPLRRNLDLKLTGLWDRGADWIIGGLFGGFIAANQVSALGPLRGYELPIADKRWTVAIIVVLLIGVRILVETATTHLYPERLEAVEPTEELEPPRIQEAISLGIQMFVLGFISVSFMGLGWALFAGVIVFFLPLIPWLFIEKVPYNAFIAKWMPGGLVKWAFIIIGGFLFSQLLGNLITDPQQSLNWGFILLPLPLLLCWALELFAENEDEDEDEEGAADEDEDEEEGRFPMNWPMRIAGVPVLAACVYTVVFVIG